MLRLSNNFDDDDDKAGRFDGSDGVQEEECVNGKDLVYVAEDL